MKTLSVLLYGSENSQFNHIQVVIESMDYTIIRHSQSSKALESLDQEPLSLAILDLDYEPDNTLQLSQKLSQLRIGFPILGICEAELHHFGHHPIALTLRKQKIKDGFLVAFSQLLKLHQNRQRLLSDIHKIIGHSSTIKSLQTTLLKAAYSQAPVLIRGESGTGKELIAKALGAQKQPFITVNCSAIPENLFESELFGHLKGSFTGAQSDRIGLFEEANGGTLFLDEIGDLPLLVQTKILRALQEGEIRPVGSSTTKKVSVRVISATHRPLEDDILQNRFREDLFYRLNVISIRVAPLRERKSDLEQLIPYFLKKYSPIPNLPLQLSSDAWMILNQYHFPGNIRELENLIYRCISLSQSQQIQANEIIPHLRNVNQSNLEIQEHPSYSNLNFNEFQHVLDQLERNYWMEWLHKCKGKVTDVAKLCGIQRTALHNRLKKLNMTSKVFKNNQSN